MVNDGVVALLRQQAAEPGAWDEQSWVAVLEAVGPWAFAVLCGVVLARAWVRRRRYRAVDVLSAGDREMVHEALRAAERRTVGEVVPVVVERSDRHPGACWLAALATTLLGSALLEGLLPWNQPALLILCQLGLGGLGYAAAALLPDVRRLFIFEERATEVAEEQAFQEFYRLGLHETQAKTGVLVFVGLLERRVVVLADQGIASEVESEQWVATSDAVLSGIRGGSLCKGLVEGIGSVAEVLAEHAPWRQGDRNELPDRLVVRRE